MNGPAFSRVKAREAANTVLPAGAVKIRPTRVRRVRPEVYYGWTDTLQLDAKLERNGVTWFRVRGGFGGKGDREDWIAALPELTVSVSDYNWNGDRFGADLGTIEEAMDGQLANELRYLPYKINEAKAQLDGLKLTEKLLKGAVA